MIQIVNAHSGIELQHIRELFSEYAVSLGIDLDYQDFDNEVASLPGNYSLPEGCLFLAVCDDQIAGCVVLRKLSDDSCEIKRLYVRPAFRGLKVGKVLAETVIQKTRSIGYSRMRLDTLPSMDKARNLYTSLGFENIEPCRYNPIEGTAYMELKLD